MKITHNTATVAKLLGCCPETVRRHVRRGNLRPINLNKRDGGSHWVFRTRDIVILPQAGNYYTSGKTYMVLRDAGILPDVGEKEGKYLLNKLVKSSNLRAIQSRLNGYWMYYQNDVENFISKNQPNDK